MITTNDVSVLSNNWRIWLRRRKECNPRRVTLSLWGYYNIKDPDESILDEVWDHYLDKEVSNSQ